MLDQLSSTSIWSPGYNNFIQNIKAAKWKSCSLHLLSSIVVVVNVSIFVIIVYTIETSVVMKVVEVVEVVGWWK